MQAANGSMPGDVAHPTARSLTGLREEAARCHACDLWRRGTQTVFGEGPRHAEMMLIGEQPGEGEDISGRPFVVRPHVIVCLGATAAQALLGRSFRVTEKRRIALPTSPAHAIVATVHSPAILRMPDRERRHAELRRFTADLAAAHELAP
jgi:uracil-DNA glycosylase